MNKVLIIIVLIDALCCITSLVLKPDPQSIRLDIIDFHWPQDAAALGNFSNYEELHFENTNIETVSHRFTSQLKKCVWLAFTNGLVRNVFINTAFVKLSIEDTNTEAVVIEGGQHYKLQALTIRRTKLTRVPKRINQLKEIVFLEITGNSIKFVSIDDFDGLNNLHTLDLSYNNIKYIHSYVRVDLPNLLRFKINNNKLQQLDVCGWNLNTIRMFELHHNEMTHFAISHFPTLEYLTLQYNPLNCAWMDRVLELDINKYMPFMMRFTCHKDVPGNFTLDCPSSFDELRQQNSNLQLELNQLREYVSNSNERFEQLQEQASDTRERLIQIEAALQKVESRTVEQNNLASDIVEAMYRMDIEWESKTKDNK